MNGYDVAAEEYKTGMGRFFSPANLDRYRKLASEAIGDSERQHVLGVLAKEMNSLRREATRRSARRGSREAPLREPDNRKRRLEERDHGER